MENKDVIEDLKKRIKVLEDELLKVTYCCCPDCGLTWTNHCLLDDEGVFTRFGNTEE